MSASAAAASFRVLLMPIDACKTILQVEGSTGLSKLGAKSTGDGRLFLSFRCDDQSDATGVLHAGAIRQYDDKGAFVRESVVEVQEGAFGKKPLTLTTALPR